MVKKNESVLFDPYSIEIEESKSVNELLNYSDVLVQVSKALIEYRADNSLTQKQLAEKLDMSQSMISKLEKGDYNATLKLLLKISYKLRNDSELFLEILKNIINVIEEKEQYEIIHENYEILSYGKMYSYSKYKAEVETKRYNIVEVSNYKIGEK